jgi:hypothetical protein
MVLNKKNLQISDFCSALPSLLVDLLDKILPILTATEGTESTEKYQIIKSFLKLRGKKRLFLTQK